VERWRREGFLDVPNSRTGQVLRLGRGALEEAERLRDGALDVTAAAGRVPVPWLIVHGTADETVPVGDGRALHAAAPGRSELLLVDGANHTFDARHPMGAPPPAADLATRATVSFFMHHLA
jgi:fermentation-respiration switch protein FrsA (DUF1100 family)